MESLVGTLFRIDDWPGDGYVGYSQNPIGKRSEHSQLNDVSVIMQPKRLF